MIILVALFCVLAGMLLFTVTFHAESESEGEHFRRVHNAITAQSGVSSDRRGGTASKIPLGNRCVGQGTQEAQMTNRVSARSLFAFSIGRLRTHAGPSLLPPRFDRMVA